MAKIDDASHPVPELLETDFKPNPYENPVKFIDMTGEQSERIPRSRISRGKTVMRDPKDVTGICVHQMAVIFGVSKRLLDAAGGDRDLAKARRFMNVPAHACASRDGFYAVHSPLEAYLHHGHEFNRMSLGLEIEGNYAGVEGKPHTAWKGASNAHAYTDETHEAAKAALKHLVEEGRKAGMPIKYIWAHRQTYRSKRGDPGGEIWRKLVLEYAVPVLGLEVQNNLTYRTGKPIPVEWDPNNGVGKY